MKPERAALSLAAELVEQAARLRRLVRMRRLGALEGLARRHPRARAIAAIGERAREPEAGVEHVGPDDERVGVVRRELQRAVDLVAEPPERDEAPSGSRRRAASASRVDRREERGGADDDVQGRSA